MEAIIIQKGRWNYDGVHSSVIKFNGIAFRVLSGGVVVIVLAKRRGLCAFFCRVWMNKLTRLHGPGSGSLWE